MTDAFMMRVIKEAKNAIYAEKRELDKQGRKDIHQPSHFVILPHVKSAALTVTVPRIKRRLTKNEIRRKKEREDEIDEDLSGLNIKRLYYPAFEGEHAVLAHLISHVHQKLVVDKESVPSSWSEE